MMDLRKVLANSYIMRGGIYLASSLAGTSRAWDCRVDRQAVGRWGSPRMGVLFVGHLDILSSMAANLLD